MKIPALITVVALGAVVAENQAKGDGLGAKTKRAFQRMGDKMRSAGHKVSKATGTDRSATDDTGSMGAPGATQQDQSRQVRMDEAYNNWKSKQK